MATRENGKFDREGPGNFQTSVHPEAIGSELDSTLHYQGHCGTVSWEGRHVVDPKRFARFVRDVVHPRVVDKPSLFEPYLRGLDTTGMAADFIGRLLLAVSEPESWEIGEALAECALEYDSGREVCWPWNTVRDRRTPRASLPGSDLVGFYREGELVFLLFGEVKTSSEVSSPPNVMYGGSGMTWQLEESTQRLDLQRTLLQWLHARCRIEPFRNFYQKAVSRFLGSEGKELVIVGVLIRDTNPNEADLESRGRALSSKLGAPTRVELFAWYLPVPIAEWPGLLQEVAP